ncbi:orotidine 5'-phosphate decarboxylase [Candidatus Woesearchaeota archaeon]|nr:orotidine 5'-phosphate decarboxylase [Candidatus Woesearchaeota archaeon]
MKNPLLDPKIRYLQIAFNHDLSSAARVILTLPKDSRIMIEAGTPFIKREGLKGIKKLSHIWDGIIVADLKTLDGAEDEVNEARDAGANAATVHGSAPTETTNLFIKACTNAGMLSMIDMLGIQEPLSVIRKLKEPPNVVIMHRGRDEERTRGKVIQYKHINKIRSKYSVLISAAGGIDLKESRSAIFNGANIVVVNIVHEKDPWTGISTESNIREMAIEFLKTIE